MNARRGSRLDRALLGALALLLLAFYLGPYVLRGFRFPLGPDAPVYLWWTRLAGHDGLSAVGDRPGLPALALAIAGALRLSPATVLSALEAVLAVSLGLAASALVRTKTEEDRELAELAGEQADPARSRWWLAGFLAGLFAAHLATGYLANLAFAVTFVAAAAALADATRRGTVVAASLLGAGGLIHPQFFLVGLAILWFTAVPSLLEGRRGEPLLDSEHGRVGAALAGGGVLLVAGLAALLVGVPPLAVDTSKDAFLRRAGLVDSLREAYRGRFLERWPRYVQWASIPAGLFGLAETTGAFLGRFLLAWSVVLIGGVAFALITAVIPPDRFVTFGFAVPMLAALGVVRLWRRLERRRPAAVLACGGLITVMVLGSLFPWRRQEPIISPEEAAQVTEAGRYAAATAPATPLLFIVDTGDPTITFFATEAANAIRAGVPPDRIRDVYVVVPEFVGTAHPARDALAELYLRDAKEAVESSGREPLILQLAAFDRASFGKEVGFPGPDGGTVSPETVSEGVALAYSGGELEPAPSPVDPLEPSSPGGIVLASIAILALLAAIGYGWARASLRRDLDALALAPAFGMSILVLVSIALERTGVPLTGTTGTALASAAAGLGGYAAWFLRKRRPPA